jgi:hypothetical protein
VRISDSRIPRKTATDVIGQCDKNCYPNIFIILKNIRDSTDDDNYLRDIVLYAAANKNTAAKREVDKID